jgi:type II secretory pathway pseudopilin PulG
MGGVKGFTLLETLIGIGIIGFILLILISTISLTYQGWFRLAEESNQSYHLRRITHFFYREIPMIDKSTVQYLSNGTRGRILRYRRIGSTDTYRIEVSNNNSLYWRRGSVSIIIENITWLDFEESDQHLTLFFTIKSKEYKLVIPW